MSLNTYPSWMTSFGPSAVVDGSAVEHADYGLVAMLGLAQRLYINFLPITWQASLGPLGQGGQSAVNQATINLQSSFAFKCFRGRPFHEGQRNPFQDIVGEMVVLSHPVVKTHPHLLRLEGICWDILDDDQVLPVLVFQKSHHGDLHCFMKTEKGCSLSVEDRLALCEHIGLAVPDQQSVAGFDERCHQAQRLEVPEFWEKWSGFVCP